MKQINFGQLKELEQTLTILANLCSKECEERIPNSPKGFVQFPHNGGADLKQISYEEWEKENVIKIMPNELNENCKEEKPKLLKLIRKIWKK